MKIGFFGGAFDPFHIEHKQLLCSAYKELSLDKIVVYPSFLPPHKNCVSSYDDRRATVVAGTSDLHFVIIDDLEKERNKVNPTNEIIPLLKERYKSDEYYFIIGGDSIKKFCSWIKPEKIAREIKIAVVGREGCEIDTAVTSAKQKFGADITVLRYCGKQISSSIIKAKTEFGEVAEEVDENVAKVIVDRKMYRNYSDIINKLKEDIPSKTFDHVKRTALYALKLNTQLGLDFNKVFLSAILHDCAKHLHRAMEGVPPAVEHQFLGAERAKEVYGITDEDILSAITYHTTGKADMSTLQKLIFCADMLEDGRTYDGVEELRQKIESDFEKGFVACVNGSMKKLISDGKPFHYLTKECYLYYNK